MAPQTAQSPVPQDQHKVLIQQPPYRQPDHAGLQVSEVYYEDGDGLQVLTPAIYPNGIEVVPLQQHAAGWEKAHAPSYSSSPAGYHIIQPEKGAGPGSEYNYSQFDGQNGGSGPGGPPPGLGRGRHGYDDDEKATICGLKRQTFWITIAITSLIVVLGVALGVGLALGLRQSSASSSSASINAAITTSTSSIATSSTTTPTKSWPAATATATTSSLLTITCPNSNLTMYESRPSPTKRKFLVLCNRDYGSNDGAVELFHEAILTFSDCIDRCALELNCNAAGWGMYKGNNTCWLKGAIGTPHAAPAWFFAVGEEILAQSPARRKMMML